MKKKQTDYTLLLIGGILLFCILVSSCSAGKSGYGCPAAKEGKRHDKNLRF